MIRKIFLAIAGFAIGAAIVTGTAVANPSTATTKLVIQHVSKGCHVWSNGSTQAASVRLTLARGARLEIVNQDIDAHRLVQLAGPTLAIHGHMMMGQQQTFTVKQPGLYRFTTKVVEMGSMMNVKTIGPDNTLRLTVSVR